MKNSSSDDFRAQIVKECLEVGNESLVARRHNLSKNTVHSWVKTTKSRGNTQPLPQKTSQRQVELEKRLSEVSTENVRLKSIVANKELELAILRELLETVNPK